MFEEINQILLDPNCSIELFFSRKLSDEYISYSPNLGDNVIGKITEVVSTNLHYLQRAELDEVDFNPIGYMDGTIEICDYDFVGNYQEVIQSFRDPVTEDIEDEYDNLSFYCVQLQTEGVSIRIFRRVTKFKKLYSKGFLAAFRDNQLNVIDSKMLGIDGDIDIIDYNNQLYIFKHISLERIFKIDEQYNEQARASLDELRENRKIANFDSFEEDCLNDKRVQKTLTKMQNENIDLATCFNNFDSVVDTINLFSLEIEYQEAPEEKIIYENKSQLMPILQLARDSYYRTLIHDNLGVDNKIGN